jgi:PhoPQ-activated pathogenicity-related protein
MFPISRTRFFGVLLIASGASSSLLSDYVSKPDDSFSWFDTGVVSKQPKFTAYLLNMTSQTWLHKNQTSRSVWTHQLIVFVPHTLGPAASSTASLYITGNKNVGGDINQSIDLTSEDVAIPSGLAVSTQSVWASLFQVPNQPIVFADDPAHVSRGEDSIIPFTWNLFMDKTPGYGPEVNVFFPMVKAAIRAMDTVTAFTSKLEMPVHENLSLGNCNPPCSTGKACYDKVCRTPAESTGGNFSIDKFVLTGASKRAWTAWLAAAVDGQTTADPAGASRVIALAPIVMDALHLEQGMKVWWKAYGGWSFAMHDFWEQNITTRIGSPEFAALCATHDPSAYAARLTMPKLVIDATGDEFFYLQDDSVWWDQHPLPGESHRLMVANAEHSFATGIPTLKPALDSFVASILQDVQAKEQQQHQHQHQHQHQQHQQQLQLQLPLPLPRLRPNVSWAFSGNENSTITVFSTDVPLSVTLFHAHTTPLTKGRRDFRMVMGDTPDDPCKTVKIPGFGAGCLNPIVWTKEALNKTVAAGTAGAGAPYEYTATVKVPINLGWRAFFVQLEFAYPLVTVDGGGDASSVGSGGARATEGDRRHIVSTVVGVVPQSYPFKDCTEDGSGCKGTIV